MLDFQKPNIEIVSIDKDNNYGEFVIEPLERGYGMTLGNSLRRIMLSSLPGCAVSSIKVEGAPHEFTSLEGVYEDVSQIILNIKQLVITLEDGVNEKMIEINASTEGAVTAGDISHDADVTIVNPDLHIATLSAGATLNIQLFVERGRGYISDEQNRAEITERGFIGIDSIYTPISKVTYNVEPTRVGHDGSFDLLNIKVWTRGGMAPEEAVALASKLMIEHLEVFVELNEKAKEMEFLVQKEDDNKTKILDTTIEFLDFSVRSYNCLKRAGINTVYDLVQKSEEDMMRVRNLGRKSLKEVKDKLIELNLDLNKS